MVRLNRPSSRVRHRMAYKRRKITVFHLMPLFLGAMVAIGSLVLWGLRDALHKQSDQTPGPNNQDPVKAKIADVPIQQPYDKEQVGENHQSLYPCNELKDFMENLYQQNENSCARYTVPRYEENTCQTLLSRKRANEYIQQHGSEHDLRQTVTAYLEGPLNDTVPGTGSVGDMEREFVGNRGTPPDLHIPLPLRTQSPADLKVQVYPKVRGCHDIPQKLPVDRGYIKDENGETVVWNHGENITDDALEDCPVDQDPFLPWIHDMFTAPDGSRIHFIAQNKRKCRSGKNFVDVSQRMLPQAALFQAVSLKTLTQDEAKEISPEQYHSGPNEMPRYRLASIDEADVLETRFICRFHQKTVNEDGEVKNDIVGETLSEFPFNYEAASHRTGDYGNRLLTMRGRDQDLLFGSNLRFSCPIPDHFKAAVASGYTVLDDGTATVTMDLIPIRTNTRFHDAHLIVPEQTGTDNKDLFKLFDADKFWGSSHVLPEVQASGRWSGLPICSPLPFSGKCEQDKQPFVDDYGSNPRKPKETKTKNTEKPHFLIGCTWASTDFRVRGEHKGTNTESEQRLREWLDFHFMVGFDHMYVYDNSGANSDDASLAGVVAEYPASKVTRIDWPAAVCNNNNPLDPAPGEGSSQYAAENSCRTRYAPYSEWFAFFDIDELMIPMGKYTSWKEILKLKPSTTNVVSLRSGRTRLRMDHSYPVSDFDEGRKKNATSLFLEAYNCDMYDWPKGDRQTKNRKEFYRSDYVLQHFVHYTLVTKQALDVLPPGMASHGAKASALNLSLMEYPDEIDEAVMLHARYISPYESSVIYRECLASYKPYFDVCMAGFPFPKGVRPTKEIPIPANKDGVAYNCYINEHLENFWVPRLKEYRKK